jgi:hypothetical protein
MYKGISSIKTIKESYVKLEKNLLSHIPTYVQQDATLHSLFYLKTALHVSGGNTTRNM